MKKSPPLQASISWTRQEIPRILCNLETHYHGHHKAQLVINFRLIIPVYIS